MKTYILTLMIGAFALVGFSTEAHAQKAVKALSKDMCKCVEKVDYSDTDNLLENFMTDCFAPALVGNAEVVGKSYNLDDEAQVEQLVTDTFLYMAEKCESFTIFLAVLGSLEEE